jgi:hypothetical protein
LIFAVNSIYKVFIFLLNVSFIRMARGHFSSIFMLLTCLSLQMAPSQVEECHLPNTSRVQAAFILVCRLIQSFRPLFLTEYCTIGLLDLNLHHSIEESQIFPKLAKRMPSFDHGAGGKHIESHKAIHKGSCSLLPLFLYSCVSGNCRVG